MNWHYEDPACKGCIYKGKIGNDSCCDYWEIVGHIRPCKPGRECTVKQLGKHNKRKSPICTKRRKTIEHTYRKSRERTGSTPMWNTNAALRLYLDGWRYADIAAEVGATQRAVESYASRNNWPAKRKSLKEAKGDNGKNVERNKG